MSIKFKHLTASGQLLSAALLVIMLNSCAQTASNEIESSSALSNSTETRQDVASNADVTPLWSDSFAATDWQKAWNFKSEKQWGLENSEVIKDADGRFDQVLRVNYPAGSASPTVSRKNDAPLGGTQFYADLGLPAKDSLRLSYYVRFSDDFDFVKGGKLPGLYGGDGASGGKTPDGTNGFSTRFMWRRNGDGELYAYLPTSDEYGTSIGRGNWQFIPGTWHHIEQEVVLNEPGQANGRVKVWLDGNMVLDEQGLTFRTVEDLKIDGIFFSTFFGGGDPSWATPKDVYVDFADFSVSEVNE